MYLFEINSLCQSEAEVQTKSKALTEHLYCLHQQPVSQTLYTHKLLNSKVAFLLFLFGFFFFKDNKVKTDIKYKSKFDQILTKDHVFY